MPVAGGQPGQVNISGGVPGGTMQESDQGGGNLNGQSYVETSAPSGNPPITITPGWHNIGGSGRARWLFNSKNYRNVPPYATNYADIRLNTRTSLGHLYTQDELDDLSHSDAWLRRNNRGLYNRMRRDINNPYVWNTWGRNFDLRGRRFRTRGDRVRPAHSSQLTGRGLQQLVTEGNEIHGIETR